MRFSEIMIILFAFSLTACVPPKQFKDIQRENKNCHEERDLLKAENEKLTVDNNELKSKIDE